MTDFTCGSGTRYGAGPETKFTLTSEQIEGAAVVLVIERNGRYRWGNPVRGGRSAFDVANYLTQIAGHILTDADCIREHAGRVEVNDPLGKHLAESNRRGWVYVIGLAIIGVVYAILIWRSGWNVGVVVSGALIWIAAMGLAYRSRRWDHLETDRLIDEQAKRDLGGTDE